MKHLTRTILKVASAVFLFGGDVHAQSGISIPWVGLVQGPLGELRQVRGVAGSFITGEIAAEGVLSSACSEQVCLVKTANSILSIRGDGTSTAVTEQVPDGPAVFALQGDHAWIYFPVTGLIAQWTTGAIAPASSWSTNDGEVLSMRVVAGQPELAIRRNGQVWIVRLDGAVVATLPATGPVLLTDAAAIYSSTDELVVRRRDASETRVSLSGAQSIIAMGPHYAQVVTASGMYVLRTDAGREGLFLLPSAAPTTENTVRPRRR